MESEYLVLTYYGYYATLWTECDMLTFVYTRGPMCQFYTALDSTGTIIPHEQIKRNCNYVIKLQKHNVACNLNGNLWAITAMATEKL